MSTAFTSVLSTNLRRVLTGLRRVAGTQQLVTAFEELFARVSQVEAAVDALKRPHEGYATLEAELRERPFVTDRQIFRTRAGGFELQARAGSTAGYLGFESVFRGPESMIRERMAHYAERLSSHTPVLELACGRGEFLDEMADRHAAATGVDLDVGMVERCRSKGHHVTQADALDHLASQPEATLGTIFSAQFIEHLEESAIRRLLSLAARKLRPRGLLVLETVNPHSLSAAKSFWIDPTHRTPLFPEALAVMTHAHGFEDVCVEFPNGGNDLNENLRQQGEYAIFARKPADAALEAP